MDDPIQTLIELALAEDIGSGDVTATYFIPADRMASATIRARKDGVISGLEVALRVFRQVDPSLQLETRVVDGTKVVAGDAILDISGKARPILTAERTALNFLQRLSGVATLTAQHVEAIKGTTARILDTRKTTPGYRQLEKQAVIHGGGSNHRMGLYDRAMVKDNHLAAEGGLAALQQAILRLKTERPGVGIELEADRLDQVEAFLALQGVDHLLLDNMSLDQLSAAVALRGPRPTPLLEASGGITLERLRAIAQTGVDFISVGALTHSAPALDLGLDFAPQA